MREEARLVRRTRGAPLGSSKRQTSTAAWTLEAAGRGLFAGTASAAAAGAPTEERSPEEEARWRRRWANRLDGEEEKEAMAMCVEVKRRVRRGLMAATVITAPRWRYRGGVGGVAAVRRPNSQGL